MNAGLLIIILLLGLALLGFPIYIALGIGALAALNLADLPLIVLPQRMFAGMNGSALLAIPFFILAGNIMSRSITGLRVAGHHSGGGSDCLRPVLRPQAQSAGP